MELNETQFKEIVFTALCSGTTAIELILCTKVLLDAISMKEFKQKHIASTYAMAIMSSEKTDWKAVNQAIVDRWSVSGLKRVKEMAWKIIEKE